MPVSAAEVAELREAGRSLSLDEVDNTLRTSAEIIGYLIHSLRSIGGDQTEVLHDVELLVRASDMWREDVRKARDTLGALGYGTDVTKLLTALARKAKPRPPSWIEQRRAERANAAAAGR
jgi:hypothetical protein